MAEGTTERGHMAVLSRLVFRVLLPVTAVFVIVMGVAYTSDVPVTDLLRDPSATLEGPWYIGLVSIAGVALWAAAAAICMICMTANPTPGERSLLFAGAVTSVILGADDAFLGHEAIKNIIGIPSPITIAIYGIITTCPVLAGLALSENQAGPGGIRDGSSPFRDICGARRRW